MTDQLALQQAPPRRKGPRPIAPLVRFERLYSPEPNTGCWLWLGSWNKLGYGRFGPGGGATRPVWAYRWAYEHFKGPVPAGLDVDHRCRVRCCVNPDHLEAVTHRVNLLRGQTLASAAALQQTCRAGHPFDDANTYRYREGTKGARNGWRKCRTCDRLNHQRRRDRENDV